ncbi:hypothetical protein ARMSODRAFT_961043 [Armillaria solidipes]|uniref:Uncharacterized protein n=1 Tax=Armillaria solidipes TaxID=1076256 RepID=A0A2H3B452_9AGAR|nr:hypothetical protein ARMSODRAFT_961043 [Armillaria solidipes]
MIRTRQACGKSKLGIETEEANLWHDRRLALSLRVDALHKTKNMKAFLMSMYGVLEILRYSAMNKQVLHRDIMHQFSKEPL